MSGWDLFCYGIAAGGAITAIGLACVFVRAAWHECGRTGFRRK